MLTEYVLPTGIVCSQCFPFINSFSSHSTPRGTGTCIIPVFQMRKPRTERLCYLPKVLELVNGQLRADLSLSTDIPSLESVTIRLNCLLGVACFCLLFLSCHFFFLLRIILRYWGMQLSCWGSTWEVGECRWYR